MINNIANILIKADLIKLKNGIWPVLEENKIKECDLANNNNYYKQFNSILQVINLLKGVELFCFTYNAFEGYSICTKPENHMKYLNPSISITKKIFLSNENIETIIKNKFINQQKY